MQPMLHQRSGRSADNITRETASVIENRNKDKRFALSFLTSTINPVWRSMKSSIILSRKSSSVTRPIFNLISETVEAAAWKTLMRMIKNRWMMVRLLIQWDHRTNSSKMRSSVRFLKLNGMDLDELWLQQDGLYLQRRFEVFNRKMAGG